MYKNISINQNPTNILFFFEESLDAESKWKPACHFVSLFLFTAQTWAKALIDAFTSADLVNAKGPGGALLRSGVN